jgi:Ala-tRNA(Pro) deacylase
MDSRDIVLETLQNWDIPFEHHTHEPAHTIDDCVKMNFITPDVVICKNIFLCNRQQTQFYLMLIHPGKQFRTADVSKELNVSRLSFAPDEYLPKMLGLLPGAVSPLGLLFDTEHLVTLVCDKAIREFSRIAFHPCVNTETVIFLYDDFFEKVLPNMNVVPIWVS